MTFLAMIASSVRGEETNGNIRSILASIFGRWMSSRTFQVELIQTSSSGGGDLTILSTIEDGTSISLSSIQNVNDVHVRMETGSIFVQEVTMKYSFFNGSNSIVASSLSSNDSAFPYTLSAGSNADMEPMLQRIGLHEVTITVQGWFGYQVGTTKTVKWNILDSSERPTNTPAGTPAGTPTLSPINGQIFIVGELKLWHKITLVVRSGFSTAEGATPNPFTDYRLDVEFRNGNTRMIVPGYYAADGNAQHTSATSGQVWHCHFAPTEIGSWSWQVSFFSGNNVAMAASGNVVGSTVSPIHGASGSFMVQPSNKTGIDLRGKGLLRRIKSKHHLQFAGNGEWFLKAGADSPENFLAFDGFDNTPNNGNRRKTWSKHLIDFKSDNPTWADGKGKGIIGAINYLSGQGMRAFSFLTMNIAGDDENVYPYVDPSDRLRFDVSKLAQWEVVFEHGTKMGMFLHFKTQERENDQLLDKGDLGNERKLYYRELIARFSHHLALNWNMGEENTNTVEQQKQFADWVKLLDPYKHPIVIHTWPTDQSLVYGPLYGYANYDGASLQSDYRDVFNDTLSRIRESVAAGNPWVVANDEQGSADAGVLPDSVDPNHDNIRREVLWGNIMVSHSRLFLFRSSFRSYSILTSTIHSEYRTHTSSGRWCRC